ncbi:metallopeptidase family protein [Desulfoglaeba alkanexedens]|jgi:predicted Zn-dependent protease with MMP-like domain|uniref:Metallopeptidase family protein n=1 Tax=Desulfoglaeba alkanexedens ALDC TaxID=980445 RepID=A0A4P8L592_9BACT|nr:metallopeptidase family protein [Desulfoglaeba alkanexedens]QCQ23148.1 metallopeptidase family protein [Desulfoglaeba alkanexedens ALDC]
MTPRKFRLSSGRFYDLVEQAVARIPMEIRRHMDNIVITVEPRPSVEMLEEVGVPPGETLLGLYLGVPLTERSVMDPPLYPDTIYLFQEPLEELCATREELIREIEITVAHEVAHALGLSDERLEELGYG